MKKLWVIHCCLLLVFPVWACDCSEVSVDLPIKSMHLGIEDSKTGISRDSLVFEGILLDVRIDSTKVIARRYELIFEMTDNYKGECLDTISVWTNHINGGCGFRASVGYYSIVHATFDPNYAEFCVFRADCWRGVSEFDEPERFKRQRLFFTSIKYQIDGVYNIEQRRYFWRKGNRAEYVKCLEYTISNGALNGVWRVFNKQAELVESGQYVDGRKTGIWIFLPSAQHHYDSSTLGGYASLNFGN